MCAYVKEIFIQRGLIHWMSEYKKDLFTAWVSDLKKKIGKWVLKKYLINEWVRELNEYFSMSKWVS